MPAKLYRISVLLIIQLIFISQISSSAGINPNSLPSSSSAIYISENAEMDVNTTLTQFIIFQLTLSISIDSFINQSVWIEYIHNINGSLSSIKSDILNLSIGMNLFNSSFSIEFFNPIGIFNFELFIHRDLGNNRSEIAYIDSFIVQVVINPFLAYNFSFIFIFIIFYILVRKEDLSIYPKSQNHLIKGDQIGLFRNGINEFYQFIPCPACHRKIPEGSAYCTFCGYHLALFERRFL